MASPPAKTIPEKETVWFWATPPESETLALGKLADCADRSSEIVSPVMGLLSVSILLEPAIVSSRVAVPTIAATASPSYILSALSKVESLICRAFVVIVTLFLLAS